MCWNAYIQYACNHRSASRYDFIQCEPGTCRGIQRRRDPILVPQLCHDCTQSQQAYANNVNRRHREHVRDRDSRRHNYVDYLRDSTRRRSGGAFRREERPLRRESHSRRHRETSYDRTRDRRHYRETSPATERSIRSRQNELRNAAYIQNAFSDRGSYSSCGSEADYYYRRYGY